MNVNGVGGPAMLGMTLSNSSRAVAAAASGTGGSTAAGVTPTTDESKLPGQPRGTTAGHELATKRHEPPRPPALPPLRGLTVAEIRAMLGVAPLPGQTETAGVAAASGAAAPAAAGSTSIITAALKHH
jgi:hypothetical protein